MHVVCLVVAIVKVKIDVLVVVVEGVDVVVFVENDVDVVKGFFLSAVVAKIEAIFVEVVVAVVVWTVAVPAKVIGVYGTVGSHCTS